MAAALWALGSIAAQVAVVGVAGAQYTWFATIHKSNLALATFVQYSAVPMTAGWQMLRRQVQPTVGRLTAVAVAGTGVCLTGVVAAAATVVAFS